MQKAVRFEGSPTQIYSAARNTNEDINEVLQDVKVESQLYFDKMDNAFLKDIAGRVGSKWKAISSVIQLEKNAGMSFVI